MEESLKTTARNRMELKRKWQQNNPEKQIEYLQTRRKASKAAFKKWYQNNTERVRANNKKWREKNPERHKELQKKYNERRKLLHPASYLRKKPAYKCKKICMEYKAKKPATGSRYAAGQYRCMMCELYLTEECVKNYFCMCCNSRVRCKPRVKKDEKTHVLVLQN